MSFVPENASALHDVLLNRLPGFAESRVLAVTGAYFKKLSERGEWTPSEEEATVIRRRDERRVLSCMVACGVVLLGTFPLLRVITSKPGKIGVAVGAFASIWGAGEVINVWHRSALVDDVLTLPLSSHIKQATLLTMNRSEMRDVWGAFDARFGPRRWRLLKSSELLREFREEVVMDRKLFDESMVEGALYFTRQLTGNQPHQLPIASETE